MAKAATPATKKVATPRPKAPAKAADQGCARAQARCGESGQGSSDPRPDRRDARHHQIRSLEKGRFAETGRDDAEESSVDQGARRGDQGQDKAPRRRGKLTKATGRHGGTPQRKIRQPNGPPRRKSTPGGKKGVRKG